MRLFLQRSGDPVNDSAFLRNEMRESDTLANEHIAQENLIAPVSNLESRSVFFDISDLLQYCLDNRAPTGIQRVQLQVVAQAVESCSATPVAMRPGMTTWRAVDTNLFVSLSVLSRSGADPDEPAWLDCITAVNASLENAADVAFAPESVLVNIGTSWWLPNYFQALETAKARYDLRYIPFIHDVIPIKVPEHCSAGLVCEFSRWIYQVLVLADSVLVNSRQTGSDVRDLAMRMHGRSIDPVVCTLDAKPDTAAQSTVLPISSDLQRLIGKEFVLFVATVESRKNHLFVFDAWIDLVRRVGFKTAPTLVCVGKRGWLAEAAIARLENSAILKEKLVILSNISDLELGALYSNCIFTVYNSFYEGWGLPVTESLCAGKVPLVARNTSLLEAGGEYAVYFTPSNREDFDARLDELIFEKDRRQALEKKIFDFYRPRSWHAITKQIIDSAASKSFRAMSDFPDRIEYGCTYYFGIPTKPTFRHEHLRGALLRKGPGWSHLEPWGIWTTAHRVRLAFSLADVRGDAILYIGLNMPSDTIDVSFEVNNWSSETTRGRCCLYVLRIPEVDLCDGRIVVEIVNSTLVDASKHSPGDCRHLGVGLRTLTVCSARDIESRITMIETGETLLTVEAHDQSEMVS